MEKQNQFKWKHYQPELILLIVRWYLRYNLSFRNLVEMMEGDYPLLTQRLCAGFINMGLN